MLRCLIFHILRIKLLLNLFVSAVGVIITINSLFLLHIDFRALTKLTTAISRLAYIFLLVNGLNSLDFLSAGHDVSPGEFGSRHGGSALAKGLAFGTRSTIDHNVDAFGLRKGAWH